MPKQFDIGRRSFLGTTAALAGAGLLGSPGGAVKRTDSTALSTGEDTIPPVEFFFPNPLLNANGEPLRDEDLIAVEAEPTAELRDAKALGRLEENEILFEGDGYLTEIPDEAPLPLVAVDETNTAGTVVGAGSLLAIDGTSWDRGNDEFFLNLWDYATGRAGKADRTVLVHEFDDETPTPDGTSSDQYWRLERFSEFLEYARDDGYEVVSDRRDYGSETGPGAVSTGPTDLEGAGLAAAIETEDPDLVMIHCPDRFDDVALEALDRYVEAGGAVLLMDSSDLVAEEYRNPTEDRDRETGQSDPSAHLNEIAEHLGAGFRFNDALVADEANNVGIGPGFEQIPVTAQFNTDAFPDLFESRPGRAETEPFYHYVASLTDINDGDTINVSLTNEGDCAPDSACGDQWELRFLGIDTPEPDTLVTERPPEWEGVADEPSEVAAIQELQFEDVCSLRAPGGGRLATDAVAVRAAPTATTRDEADGDTYVDYAETRPPLVAVEQSVAGVGSLLVDDASPTPTERESRPQYDLVLNLWDALTGGGATVLYDEGHGQSTALSDYSAFTESDGGTDNHDFPEHYTVEVTTGLAADLQEADALWLTPPAEPFSAAELEALSTFVEDGGAVFLHGRADATSDAHTANLNDVAAAVEAGFRFNDDTVVDPESNGGSETRPATDGFDASSRFRYFTLRQTDGSFGDNPNEDVETAYRSQYLKTYADEATEFANDEFNEYSSDPVVFEFDPRAGITDGLGRVLTYIWSDPSNYPAGKSYNRRIVEAGLARVYDSQHSKHDEFLAAELDARADRKGVWTEYEPAVTQPVYNHSVRELYVPYTASVRTEGGPLPAERAPVRAEPTATQTGDPSVAYDREVPLVGVDENNRVGMIGGPLLDENLDIREDDFRTIFFIEEDPLNVNTADFGNYPFTTNLLDYLKADAREGAVVVEGRHDQFGGSVDRFGSNYKLSLEDARYYERYLEGVGLDCEAINDLPANLPGDTIVRGRALIVSTPARPYTDEELAAVRQFRDNGGGVLLVGSSEASTAERANLDEIAAALDSDLRLNDDSVVDDTSHLRDQPAMPITTNFDESFPLFEPRPVETGDGGAGLDRAVERVTFASGASLRDADGGPLTDRETVAIWAESTATNADTDGSGGGFVTSTTDRRTGRETTEPYEYEKRLIPLAAVDDRVVGFGAVLAADERMGVDPAFLLNVWDDRVDGTTVLWDEGHGQFYDTGRCSRFIETARESGYRVRATTSLGDDLGDADAVVITSPSQAFSESELDALSAFVDDGGAVFLHDQSDFNSNDDTPNLNPIAETLELPFRFQDDEVSDQENNGGDDFQVVTTQLNRSFPFFGGTEPEVESDLSAAGARDGDADAYSGGQTARIDVFVHDVSKPATLTDRVPPEWTVVGGDATAVDEEAGVVTLGTVEPTGGPIVRTYFVEAPSDATRSGPAEFGPAEATAGGTTVQVAGTDENVLAGADQNDPAGSTSEDADAPGGEIGPTADAPDGDPTGDGPVDPPVDAPPTGDSPEPGA